ncbi:M20/M25/M40 family metallo-hydrolase [Sphingorhabdus wooponensis]|jgi:acetylornithine deacetylase/succinyl-diaminopimelate desuccinylase-like protein|uniref:M20/M25/M40 family metallo-hydrolase n=1 Tax=Sphingorhabdus wooponensis TaxID=940136 RepID=A0A426RPM9_9SPHN|nr:M20/M25/M40 family metallo-hydrolase [Sphingorhabdus wooponensis]RRQ50955.1 M20/M25/M40 family metallo-hydrolase [Sphingorhabdus wooponensis]
MGQKTLFFAGLLALTAATNAQAQSAQRSAERDLFAKIVEIPTVDGQPAEFKKLTALLSAEFRKAGITNVIVKDHDNTQTLIARWPAAKPSGKKPILLMAHMDVVAAKASDWKYPPFQFREEGGYYLGRGSNDNKAALTGIVLALQYLRAEKFEPTRDIIVLFTGDEETTGNGARRAANQWRDLIDAEYALNGDAGGGTVFPDGRVEGFGIQIAEKTYADFRMTAVNRGGHSSAPRPDNAIYALANALTAVERHRFPAMINDATRASFEMLAKGDSGQYGELLRRFLADPQDRETADLLEAMDPGSTRTRCVATMLSGGHAPNALPQKAEANVNCRIFPSVKIEDVRQQLQSLAGPDVTVSAIEGSQTPETAPSPMRDDILQAYRAAVGTRFPNAPVLPFQSAGATDGAFLRAAGIPVYGFGGLWGIVGQREGAHGLDERVWAEGFHGQIPIWMEMLRRVAGT